MPRLRRRKPALRFRTTFERRQHEILQDLRRQRTSNPSGPWTAPRCLAALCATWQLRREIRAESETRNE
jgi:hypothetical protein